MGSALLAVAAMAALVWLLLWRVLPPVRGHLTDRNGDPGKAGTPADFLLLLKDRNAWRGLVLMMMAVLGHFVIIPYLSPFLVRNVGMPETSLFLVYLVGGLVTVFTGPLIGRMADRYGRLRVYTVLVAVACVVIRVLTSSGPRPVWEVLILAGFFFAFGSGRFVPVQAVISLAVSTSRRGAYMSLVSCSRDLVGGLAAMLGSRVVSEGSGGHLLGFQWLGWLAITLSVASLWIFRKVRVGE